VCLLGSTDQKGPTTAADACAPLPAVLKPRQPASTLDTGNTQRQSGWFDVQCQGANNDFCRWLPSSAGIQGEYWSCALAGSDSPSTLPGEFSDSFTINSTCEEQGYRGRPRTDLSCDGPNLSAPSGNGCRCVVPQGHDGR
jgi:hypothetical protein